MTCEMQRLCILFCTILAFFGTNGRALGATFPVTISDFTAKEVDGRRIHLSWNPSSQPSGLKYKLQQKYLRHNVEYNLNDRTTTETEVKIDAYKCVPINFTMTPYVDGVEGESVVTVFEFAPEKVKIKKVEHETDMHDNDETISWRIDSPSSVRCKFRYVVTVNDEAPTTVDKMRYEMKDITPMELYRVRVRVLFSDESTSPARGVTFRGRYGGLYPDKLRFSTDPQVGLLKLHIYRPENYERTPVKMYHVDSNLNIFGYPTTDKSTERDFEIRNYEACSDFGVKVYQETMDETFSKIDSEYKSVQVLPHKPATPVLKCMPGKSGISLEWKRFEVEGNNFCKKSFEISWTNSRGESGLIRTKDVTYFMELTGKSSSEYIFQVSELAEDVAKSDQSAAVSCYFTESR